MNYISAKDLKNKLDSGELFFLLDVRENYEREMCAIESIHIPMADVFAKINELPSDKKIVVICRSGKRAEAVANILCSDYKMENVMILDGGLLSWAENIDSTLQFD
jgi:rhodanese-related sulfurtransferase